jgi:serine/threonine-protein kinase
MPLTSNQVLHDRYEVVRSIKSGGMGAVYEARDLKLASSPCAIKEILHSALQGADANYVLKSFESEMRSLATLEHPSIPRVRDYFDIDGRRYIVLDLIQGQALDDELADHLRLTQRPMDPAVVALDMVTVLETLTYLHSQRPPIVHRDIKSANLVRDARTGKIKLVDFGIARSVETQRVQTQIGTPGFCAPEQIAGRAEVRSDLFSVGATIYHLSTGKLPPRFAFEPMDPELPEHPGLVKIVRKATQVKPSERYANAEEMAEALRRWLKNEASAKIEESRLSPGVRFAIHPLATPPPAPNSNPHLVLAATALSLLAAAVLWAGTPSQVVASPSPKPPMATRVTPSPGPSVADAPVAPATRPRVLARPARVVPERKAPVVVHPQPEPVAPQLPRRVSAVRDAYPRASARSKSDPVASPAADPAVAAAPSPEPGSYAGGFARTDRTASTRWGDAWGLHSARGLL